MNRVFEILEFLGRNGPSGITEISDGIAQNKSTVYRFLSALEALGYVSQDADTDKYTLTLKILRLGTLVQASTGLIHMASETMAKLAESTREAVHLAILDTREVVYVDEIETIHSLRMVSRVGRSDPAHCTALGKALLAYKSEDEIRAIYDGTSLERFTPNTITRIVTLINELQAVRTEGVSVDNEEYESGLVCVAAPVFDHNGQAVASIAVSVPSVRLWNHRIDEIKEQVRIAGTEISFRMGFDEVQKP